MSARPSTDSLPPTCSGDMYDALPSTSPCRVSVDVVSLAMPKSSSFTVPSVEQEDVGRLDVAMHDALLVRVVQARSHSCATMFSLSSSVSGSGDAMRASSGVPRRNSITMYGVLSSSANSKIVTMLRVLELGGGPRFAVEARPHLLGVFREVGEHQLDRDFAIEHRVDAAIEHAHAALADALEDLVASDLFRDWSWPRRVPRIVLFSWSTRALRHLAVRIVRRQPLDGLLVFLQRVCGRPAASC